MSFTINSSRHPLRLKDVGYSLNSFDDLELKIKDEQRALKELAYKINSFSKGMRLIDLTDSLSISADWKDFVSVESDFQDKVVFMRTFTSLISFNQVYNKNIAATKRVSLEVSPLKVNNVGQVVSDIRFYNKALNETNFDETFTPFGYGRWKRLITGDYIFKKALCKYVIQASVDSDRPNVRQYVHKADVPDRVAQGVVNLTKTNQPYVVHFDTDRLFHIVPEINVSIKSYSGTNVAPLIIPFDVTRTGFKVIMKGVDGEYVDGSITYSARGY